MEEAYIIFYRSRRSKFVSGSNSIGIRRTSRVVKLVVGIHRSSLKYIRRTNLNRGKKLYFERELAYKQRTRLNYSETIGIIKVSLSQFRAGLKIRVTIQASVSDGNPTQGSRWFRNVGKSITSLKLHLRSPCRRGAAQWTQLQARLQRVRLRTTSSLPPGQPNYGNAKER